MADLLTQIAAWIEVLVLTIGYPGIWLVMFVENLFPPVPTDPLLPFAGILAAQGYYNFLGVWAAAVLGATCGSLVLYSIGRWADETVVRALVRRYGRWMGVSEQTLERGLLLFNRYGPAAVYVGRWLPVVRSAVSLTAGVSKMNLLVFTCFTAFSSATVTIIWITLGYLLGENWRVVLALVTEIENLPLALALLAGTALLVGGYLLARRWWSRRRVADDGR